MVEAYKTRAPQERSAEPRESAREKLDALVKDTAAKLSGEDPEGKVQVEERPGAVSQRGGESCLGT